MDRARAVAGLALEGADDRRSVGARLQRMRNEGITPEVVEKKDQLACIMATGSLRECRSPMRHGASGSSDLKSQVPGSKPGATPLALPGDFFHTTLGIKNCGPGANTNQNFL